MLIVKIYVNTEEIDQIHIQRLGPAAEWNDYAIRKPAVEGTVRHCRADGAVALVAIACKALADAGYGQYHAH